MAPFPLNHRLVTACALVVKVHSMGRTRLLRRRADLAQDVRVDSRQHHPEQRTAEGSGANFDRCMLLSGEGLCRFHAASTAAQVSGAVVSLPVRGFEVELVLLDFLRQLNAADGNGRRLESLSLGSSPLISLARTFSIMSVPTGFWPTL
jgi:hypothetical protein